ncbi:uncharacterized protein [Gossypium hirsutum]|uniref:Retrotransposon gag domain-containing protein n=1 Tax=Gossypium hirsutum TaxID=3635 RepID=A0ABM2YMZ9_GOSHI|nr:uncharacterized protein LOC121205062 [Gossypium hirsutum]
MSDRPEQTEQEEVNSRVQTSEQGTIPPVAPPPPPTTESGKCSPFEKLRKHGAEEFRGRTDDDPVKAEYWLQSIMRVFKQMACSPDDYLICAVSLLKEEAYNWWETIEAVVPAEKITWEFFQNEFKKKYVGRRYLDKKKREFLDLRQGNKSVAECEREFVYLSKYARDIVPTEEEMCIRFEEGLNDEIKMMIGGIEIREFVVLSDRAQKLEEVYNKKMQRDRRSKESFKRSASKSFSALLVKKSKEEFSRATSVPERLGKVGQDNLITKHLTDLLRSGTEGETENSSSKRKTLWSEQCYRGYSFGYERYSSRSEVRAPARTYAIRAREEATAPDVITASEKNLFVEPTDYDVQVTNPLGQSVVVNLICHNCPLKVKGCDFPADLMLLPFREFDIILGMNWLTKHDAVVNCREKRISLKCQTGDIVLVESGNLDDMVRMISFTSAQKLLRKGNEAYLAYILDTRSSKSKLEQLSVVNEFMDKNVEFVWSDEFQQSFDQLKKMLTEAPVLTQSESAELKTKPVFFQRIRELQDEDPKLVLKRQMVRDNLNLDYSIDNSDFCVMGGRLLSGGTFIGERVLNNGWATIVVHNNFIAYCLMMKKQSNPTINVTGKRRNKRMVEERCGGRN